MRFPIKYSNLSISRGISCVPHNTPTAVTTLADSARLRAQRQSSSHATKNRRGNRTKYAAECLCSSSSLRDMRSFAQKYARTRARNALLDSIIHTQTHSHANRTGPDWTFMCLHSYRLVPYQPLDESLTFDGGGPMPCGSRTDARAHICPLVIQDIWHPVSGLCVFRSQTGRRPSLPVCAVGAWCFF